VFESFVNRSMEGIYPNQTIKYIFH